MRPTNYIKIFICGDLKRVLILAHPASHNASGAAMMAAAANCFLERLHFVTRLIRSPTSSAFLAGPVSTSPLIE